MTAASLSGRRLSALIVNHNSGAWTQRCAESLQTTWAAEGGQAKDLEIIVLDSGSELGESTWWRTLRRAGVRVRTSPANVGYATGLNMAYELSSGAAEDTVALLNPDLHFLQGSIGPLLKHLEEYADTGAVQPRIYLDEDLQVLLPPNELPSPLTELADVLATHFPGIARWRADRKSREAQAFWSTQECESREMLSGACLFMRRSTIDQLGQVMDGRFPLYFEDADLCRQLKEAGYDLVVEPASEILHHWSRSAGPDFVGEVAARHAYGRSLYMAKHHRGVGALLIQACARFLASWRPQRAPLPMHSLLDFGDVHQSPEFPLPADTECSLEISLTPFWGLSAGTMLDGGSFHYSAKAWSWLFPGTYYVRGVERSSGQLLGAWRFHKTSPARSWPLDPQAGQQPGRSTWRESFPGERVG